jgi:hypothetical protein
MDESENNGTASLGPCPPSSYGPLPSNPTRSILNGTRSLDCKYTLLTRVSGQESRNDGSRLSFNTSYAEVTDFVGPGPAETLAEKRVLKLFKQNELWSLGEYEFVFT